MYFGNYILGKRWLDKCLKSPVSEDPPTNDIVNHPKKLLKSEGPHLYHIY